MKTSRSLVQRLSLLAGGWLICLPVAFAGPGGSGTAVGTASGGGGGHAGSSASSAGAHSSSVAVGVGHSTVGVSNGFRSSANGMSGLRPGFGTSTGITRYTGGNPAATSNVGPQAASTRALYSAARVNNAWSDPVNSRVAGTENTRPGNHLNPGAYGYRPGRGDNGQNTGEGSRSRHRYYYNNFPYGVYYPYLYNNYGYGGYGNYGFDGGVADSAGLSTDNGNADLGAPNFSNVPNNYYSYADPATPAQPLPDAPAVGPQNPSSAEKPATASQGPDSLVEAVQNELSRRGYFEGKADAMYSAATKEAIRRFQTDQHLPATGRINEATLHALRLD